MNCWHFIKEIYLFLKNINHTAKGFMNLEKGLSRVETKKAEDLTQVFGHSSSHVEVTECV
jgi:hypothetical protein